jgi:hypothetical protein
MELFAFFLNTQKNEEILPTRGEFINLINNLWGIFRGVNPFLEDFFNMLRFFEKSPRTTAKIFGQYKKFQSPTQKISVPGGGGHVNLPKLLS